MKINKTIRGERVLLRDYAVADLCSLTDMWLDPVNGKYMSDPTREFVDERFQRALNTLAESEAGYYLTVEEASSGEIIGSACAFPDETCETYDIGYCIHKSRWHRGFGTEAVTLLLEELRRMGAKVVTAEAAQENGGSVNCSESWASALCERRSSRSTTWTCATTATSSQRSFRKHHQG